MMLHARTIAVGVAILAASQPLAGQEPARYRNFELRSGLAAVTTAAGIAATEARTVHERPARLQDLEWRPSRWTLGSAAPSTDAVEQLSFSFYNDQLFQIVVDYLHGSTEGMTDADMIEAVSAVYGPRVTRSSRALPPGTGIAADSGVPLARWGGADHVVALYRLPYREAFRLVVTDPGLESLARRAGIQAARLDEQEAPRRELARAKKEIEDGRAAAEKARAVNKQVFVP